MFRPCSNGYKSRTQLLHRSNGSRATTGPKLCNSLLIKVSSLIGVSQVGLSLTILGQVKSCSLFNLLLEGLNPALKLINQSLHALMVLAIFIGSKAELLDAALRPAEVLDSISLTAVLSIQLRFQLPDTCLHLVHCLLSSLQSICLCLIQTLLHILQLALIELAVLLIGLSHILLSTKLIQVAFF